jgi:hypothetical protein
MFMTKTQDFISLWTVVTPSLKSDTIKHQDIPRKTSTGWEVKRRLDIRIQRR